ncbi:MAG TPA: lactate utilization protein [Anaerolineales bacterium]|jgi:L-lactate dehydrogenase complex protein LldG
MTNPVILNVRRSLARVSRDSSLQLNTVLSPRPAIHPARQAGAAEAEIELFLEEVRKLSGNTQLLGKTSTGEALAELVTAQGIHKATVWETSLLNELDVAGHLRKLGVELVSPNAGKNEMAGCDLGVTEADHLLPETGTLVLKSSTEKPRGVSLLPRIHLAIVTPDLLRADLHQVFAEEKNSHYLVFITGPSRTADIELTVTLGVHGPKNLYVWMLSPDNH